MWLDDNILRSGGGVECQLYNSAQPAAPCQNWDGRNPLKSAGPGTDPYDPVSDPGLCSARQTLAPCVCFPVTLPDPPFTNAAVQGFFVVVFFSRAGETSVHCHKQPSHVE